MAFFGLAFALHAAMPAEAQTGQSISLHVEETAGIRRTRYPVNARVPFPQGALARADQVRLVLDGDAVPAQFAAGSRWPDGSVQWLTVDFNASIGPEETRSYRLEYGPGRGCGGGGSGACALRGRRCHPGRPCPVQQDRRPALPLGQLSRRGHRARA